MLNTLTKKRGKKGFTLMELLIVVAIIAILVAISIPVFTNQLEKARESTDVANVRAAKALAVATYLTSETQTGSVSYWYDAANGKLINTSETGAKKPAGYHKGTETDAGIDKDHGANTGDGCTFNADSVVKVTVDKDGNVSYVWE